MPRAKREIFETFEDGVLLICGTKGRQLVENRFCLRFGERTVGERRYWDAKAVDSRVERLVSVPMVKGIDTLDIVLIGGVQYKILQVQKIFSSPPCLYLSLEQNIQTYEDAREDGSGD